MWGLLRESEGLLFPRILILVNVMFLIPVQTADVERGFSVHRILKNRLSNRLKIHTLDSLFRVKLLTLGKSIFEFDYESAAKKHSYVAFDKRDDFLLRALFLKVNQVEMGLLEDGIDEGPEPENLAIVGGDSEDDEEVSEEGFWLSSDDEVEGEVVIPENEDCFGEVCNGELGEGSVPESAQAMAASAFEDL